MRGKHGSYIMKILTPTHVFSFDLRVMNYADNFVATSSWIECPASCIQGSRARWAVVKQSIMEMRWQNDFKKPADISSPLLWISTAPNKKRTKFNPKITFLICNAFIRFDDQTKLWRNIQRAQELSLKRYGTSIMIAHAPRIGPSNIKSWRLCFTSTDSKVCL